MIQFDRNEYDKIFAEAPKQPDVQPEVKTPKPQVKGQKPTFSVEDWEGIVAEPDVEVQPEANGDFTQGVKRGFKQLGGLGTAGLGLAAGALGFEEFEQQQLDEYIKINKELQGQDYAARVGSVEEINDLNDFLDWGQGVLGEQVPMLLGAITSGGIGAFIGKKVAEGIITKKVGEEALKKAIALGAKRGAAAGVFGFSATLEGGGISGEQEEARQEDPEVERSRLTALGFGAMSGALETFPFMLAAKAIGIDGFVKGKILNKIAKMGTVKKMAATGLLIGGAESATEFGQEVLAIAAREVVDENYDVLGEEKASRLLNAAAGGFVGGGVPGGIIGGFTRGNESESATLQTLAEAEGEQVKAEVEIEEATGEGTVQPTASEKTVVPDEVAAKPEVTKPIEEMNAEELDAEFTRVTDALGEIDQTFDAENAKIPLSPKDLSSKFRQNVTVPENVASAVQEAKNTSKNSRQKEIFTDTVEAILPQKSRQEITDNLNEPLSVVGAIENHPGIENIVAQVKRFQEKFLPNTKLTLYTKDVGALRGLKESTLGSAVVLQQGEYGVYLSDTVLAALNSKDNVIGFLTLSHEIGHVIHREHLGNAPKKVQLALYREYLNGLRGAELQTGNPSDVLTVIKPTFAVNKVVEPLLTEGQKSLPKGIQQYSKFNEWLADRFAVYVSDKGSEKGLIAKHFDSLILKLKKLFTSIKNKLAPQTSFDAWMDRLMLEVKRNETFEELAARESGKPEVVPNPTVAVEEAGSVQKDLDKLTTDLPKRQKAGIVKLGFFLKYFGNLIQIGEQNASIPGVSNYVESVRNWWRDKTVWTERADSRLEEWRKLDLNKKEKEAFNNLFYKMTELSDKKERALRVEEKLQVFKEFGFESRKDLQEFYESIQGDFKDSLKAFYAELEKDAKRKFAFEEPVKFRELQAQYAKELKNLTNREYFPLTRYGDFWVWHRDNEATTLRFETFENEAEMNKGLARIKAGAKKRDMVSGGKFSENSEVFRGLPLSMLKHIEEQLGLTEEQKTELKILQHALSPGQGHRKRLLHRKGTPGFLLDAKRGYGNYFMHFGNFLSRLQHYASMKGALDEVEAYTTRREKTPGAIAVDERKLADYLQEHYDYVLNPGEEWANVRSLAFLWYLGFMPKSAAVNLTQVPLVTFPYLTSRYGELNSVRELTKGMRDVRKAWQKGQGLEPELMAALEEGMKAGFLDESLATELAAVAEGSNLQQLFPGTFLKSESAARNIRKVAGYGAWMFQKVEKMNRLQTFVAAFRLETQKLKREGVVDTAELQSKAYIAGRSAVDSTQYEYGRWVRAKALRGKKSVAFVFMQYLFNTLYFAGHDQAKWRFLMMMGVMGGLSGLPGSEDMLDLFDAAATKFKEKLGWKNPKVDARLEMRKFIKELGANPDLIMHGASSESFGLSALGDMVGLPIPGVNMSGSISLGRIVPGVEQLAGREGDLRERFAAAGGDAGGAVFGIISGMISALASNDPDSLKRWERAMPSAMKGISRASRFLEAGGERVRGGAEIVDFDLNDTEHLAEIGAQALGFLPTRVSREKEKRWMQKEHAKYWTLRRKVLMEQFAYTVLQKDKQGTERLRRKIRAFNASAPSRKIKISSDNLRTSLKTRRASRLKVQRGRALQNRNQRIYNEVAKGFGD